MNAHPSLSLEQARLLRSALVGMVGTDNSVVLDRMERELRELGRRGHPPADLHAPLAAIHALRETRAQAPAQVPA